MNKKYEKMSYYYAPTDNPLRIESTDLIEELVTLLFEGKAIFINEGQQKELNLPNNYNYHLRKKISKFSGRIPLYDVMTNRIYLINKENVFTRIHDEHYRFIDKFFLKDLLAVQNKDETDKINIRILSNYDLNVLYNTYTKIFYESYVITSYITHCKRPSFYPGMEHISPYYKINELYYLAYDWNLTTSRELSQKQIEKLCKKITKYDISAKTLINHQLYIYDSKAIGLVKHYSLFGSYYINLYLRKNLCCLQDSSILMNYQDITRNLYLENQTKIMINLIINAPAFDKTHTVYRFVDKDDYIRHLNIGDVYQDPSFMSTTRNPFYYKENYNFGYILLKIKLPKNIKGVGICVEAYSNFPSEEEIILLPGSKYKLLNVIDNEDITKYHGVFDLSVKKKYEFEWIGNDFLQDTQNDNSLNNHLSQMQNQRKKIETLFDMPGAYIPVIPEIDMMQLLVNENIKHTTISDRLAYFRTEYVDTYNNQFISIIAGTKYIFNMDSYDSSSVYKKFFYYEVNDGIMITTSNPKYGNINILMELGTEIHVNYYFRFSITDPSAVVDLNKLEWIEWLSLLAYVIGSRTIIIHSNYSIQYNKHDTLEEKQNKTKYVYSQNIYAYMKNKKKMLEFDEITPNFDYSQLDYLFKYPLKDLIKITDSNELYRISQISNTDNIGDFYLYIVENFPRLISLLEEKIETIFDPEKNPFKNISYKLDAWRYLYNKNLIPVIPSEKEFVIKKGFFKKLIGNKKILKFKNRLRNYLVVN